jgi:hypothetical protein
MEIDEHIAIVRREGERLADVAGQTSFDADVGTCPGWTIQDLVRTSQDEPVVRRGLDGEADLRVRATASDLFLLVWNRRAQDGLEVVGDTSLLDLWRQSVFVRWR